MKKIVIASTNKSAGKTSVIAGLFASGGKKLGYMKPFGDRMVYNRKKLWDHDACFFAEAFGLGGKAEDLTLAFDHAKLLYMYKKPEVRKRVLELASKAGKGKDALVIEGGSELWHGAAVHLDAISLAKYLDAKLVLVVDGNDYDVLDDIFFMKDYIDKSGVGFSGVIVNKIADVADFNLTHVPVLRKEGVKVLGVLPHTKELGFYTARYLADSLFARTVTGERGMDNTIKNIFVGDLSASAALKNHSFRKEGNLVITSGDRSDMVLAALDSGASCILLTNNMAPSPHVISKASHSGVPLLLVQTDTYATAEKIRHLEPLLTRKDPGKINLLKNMVKKNVKLSQLTGK